MSVATLADVLKGWDGYSTSIIRAIQGLTDEQLAYRIKDGSRSAAEIARHVAIGRLCWFIRMEAPGSQALSEALSEWVVDGDGNRHPVEAQVPLNRDVIVRWLESSWDMMAATLEAWTIDDLGKAYEHTFRGVKYTVTRQWTIFRILAHDIHHGGQMSLLLDIQGVDAPDLIWLGGHIIEPEVVE